MSLRLAGLPLPLLVVATLVIAGCHPRVTDPNDPKFVVAEKGDWKVTRGELDNQLSTVLKQHNATPQQLGPDKMRILESEMLDNIVLKKLVLDKAAALPPQDTAKLEAGELDRLKGPATDDQLAQKLKAAGMTLDQLKEQIHQQALIQKVLDAEAFQNVEPTEQEIDDIYMKNQDKFVTPPQVRASRVLIMVNDNTSPAEKAAKKKAIDQAHDRVMHGEDFSKVAMAVSQDQYSAPRGGDVDWFKRGQNEPKFDDVAFSTKKGAISPVFETAAGYQFLKVTDIQPAGTLPIADARNYITGRLREMKMRQAQQAFGKKLLAESGVTYHLVRVDPAAQPPPGTPPESAPDAAQPTSVPAQTPDAPPAH